MNLKITTFAIVLVFLLESAGGPRDFLNPQGPTSEAIPWQPYLAPRQHYLLKHRNSSRIQLFSFQLHFFPLEKKKVLPFILKRVKESNHNYIYECYNDLQVDVKSSNLMVL